MANPNQQRSQVWMLTDLGYAYYMDFHMVVDENHDMSADVTEHAVESGANIVDHIRWRPERVSFRCFVSNCPIGDGRPRQAVVLNTDPGNQGLSAGFERARLATPTATTTLLSPGRATAALKDLVKSLLGVKPAVYTALLDTYPDEDIDDVQAFLERLEVLRTSTETVQIHTPKKSYDNMVLESVAMTRGREDGDGASITLGFRRIRIVSTKKVAAPASFVERGTGKTNKGTQSKEPAEVKKSHLVRGGTAGVARAVPD